MQRNIDRADQVVAISKFALDFAAEHLDLKNTPATVIYNGNAVTEFPDFDAPAYRPVKPFLFTLGLVQPRKNLHVLPALLAGNEYELIIAGLNHFDYTQKIIEEAKKWKVEDRVKLIGPIDEKNKYWYYKNCEAFIFPSIAEGFGIPPLEAMHFGKPVFLSKFMSLPEIGGDVAFYFNDFEPEGMRKTFEDGMAFYNERKPQEKIKQHAAQFSWDKAATEYLNVYRDLLSVH
jgi:glycosyltransferase involved in cell wall biosynthesis